MLRKERRRPDRRPRRDRRGLAGHLHQLDEHAAHVFRMEERVRVSREPRLGTSSTRRTPSPRKRARRRYDVVHAIGHVMHARAARREEPAHRRVRAERPEQLDEGRPRREENLLDPLILYALPMGGFDPQRAPIVLDGALQIVDRDAHVVDAEDRRFLRILGCIRAIGPCAAATWYTGSPSARETAAMPCARRSSSGFAPSR